MKRIIYLLLASFFAFNVSAKGGDSEKIIQSLKSKYESFSFSLSKNMNDFFDLDIDLNGKEKWITGDFSEGKLLILDEGPSGSDVRKMFQKEGFQLVNLDEDDDENQVSLFVSREGKIVKEAHFIVGENEKIVLFSIYGEMKVKEKK